MRADEVAHGLVDAVLDDAEIGTVERQKALLRAVEVLYPQVSAQVEVEIPEDAESAAGLDWEQLQALAQAHLGGVTGGAPPVPQTRMVEPHSEV